MEQDFLEQTNGKEIDLIVCTDSEAILGIGDQGVGVSLVVYACHIPVNGDTQLARELE